MTIYRLLKLVVRAMRKLQDTLTTARNIVSYRAFTLGAHALAVAHNALDKQADRAFESVGRAVEAVQHAELALDQEIDAYVNTSNEIEIIRNRLNEETL